MNPSFTPVVIDLGMRKSRTLRDLMKAEGPLMEEVAGVLDDVREKSPELATKELVPVVMIYRRRQNRNRRCRCKPPLPFCIGCP